MDLKVLLEEYRKLREELLKQLDEHKDIIPEGYDFTAGAPTPEQIVDDLKPRFPF